MRKLALMGGAIVLALSAGVADASPGKGKGHGNHRADTSVSLNSGKARASARGRVATARTTPNGYPLPPYRGYRPTDRNGIQAGLRVRTETGESLGRIMRTYRGASGQTWAVVELRNGKTRTLPADSIHVRNGVAVVGAVPARRGRR